jgi:hypothetical protein
MSIKAAVRSLYRDALRASSGKPGIRAEVKRQFLEHSKIAGGLCVCVHAGERVGMVHMWWSCICVVLCVCAQPWIWVG